MALCKERKKERKIRDLCLRYSNVKVSFLHVPYYSIEKWNGIKGHPNPSSFKEADKILTYYIDCINDFITDLNTDLGTYSPSFNEDIRRSRKSVRGKQRYSINFKSLPDGIHPDKMLAKSWLKSLSRKVERDCTN